MADLIVNDKVIVELKSIETLLPVHKKQLLTYLKLANKRLGLLLNFGAPLDERRHWSDLVKRADRVTPTRAKRFSDFLFLFFLFFPSLCVLRASPLFPKHQP